MKRGIVIIVFSFVFLSGSAQTGIGTSTPVNKFQVETTLADPATSGATANGNFRLSGTTGSHVLDFGLSSSATYSWLQSRSRSDYGTNFNLVLNPNRGNVGIGTTTPGATLEIGTSNGNVPGFLILNPTTTGTGFEGAEINFRPAPVTTSPAAQTWVIDQVSNANNPRLRFFPSVSGESRGFSILDNGNFGIGTAIPSSKLNIVGGGIKIHNGFSNNTIRPSLTTTSIGNFEIRGVGSVTGSTQEDGGDDGFLRLSAGGGTNTSGQSSIDLSGFSNVSDMSNNIVMRTAGTERLRINNLGNVGIGTANPTERLQVSGNIIASNLSASSDVRFKTNISPIENALQKVLQLRGMNFDWKTKEFPDRAFSDNRALGFIAQEVEQVLPEVVQTEKTAEGYKSVQYDKVVALLVEAIKEQQKQIEVLQKEVKKIKRRKK